MTQNADSGRVTDYGFEWGPMEVHRLCWVEGRGRVVSIRTEFSEIQVLVSEKGRKVRAWRGNDELVSPNASSEAS